MFDILKQISSIPSINGSEYLLSQFLKKHFVEKGFSVTNVCGNTLFITQNCDPTESPDTVIFTPLDSSGFTCLYKEGETAFLTPTSSALKNFEKFESVTDLRGVKHSVKIAGKDNKTYTVENDAICLGDAFSLADEIELSEDAVIGWSVARFACIALMCKLIEAAQNPRVAFCFTAGFNTLSKAESNVILRFGIKNAIFLGFDEDESALPILLKKDGKRFSSVEKIEKVLSLCQKEKIAIEEKISDEAVTAAERTFAPSLKSILSLALPCSNQLSAEESVQLSALDSLFKALVLILENE